MNGQIVVEHEIMNPLNFLLGGRAEFTIKNIDSGVGFKYKVTKSKNYQSKNGKGHMYFVKVKSGSGWVYAGFLKEYDGKFYFGKGNKGNLEENSLEIKGLMYAIKHGNSILPRPMVMIHHCKCASCGKKLDDEESIQRGFGPVCWNRAKEIEKMQMPLF